MIFDERSFAKKIKSDSADNRDGFAIAIQNKWFCCVES